MKDVGIKPYQSYDDEGKWRTMGSKSWDNSEGGPVIVTIYGDCTLKTLEQIKKELDA